MQVLEVGINGVHAVQLPHVAGQRIRFELQVLAARNIPKALYLNILSQPAGNIVIAARPVILLVRVRDVPLQDDSPGAHLSRIGVGEVHAGERNPHQHHVTPWGAPGPCVPHRIERKIVAGLLAVKGVGLDTERIAREDKGAALIVKRIQHNLDAIVVAQRVARHHVRSNQVRRAVPAHECCIKVLVRVAQVSSRLVAGMLPIFGKALHKSVDAKHLRGARAGCSQKIAQLRGNFEPRNHERLRRGKEHRFRCAGP